MYSLIILPSYLGPDNSHSFFITRNPENLTNSNDLENQSNEDDGDNTISMSP